ncbi:hypothetical protein DLAC_09161 [Tieghemostelium lacteum]|uniref:Uncharacterized protein n=1 Tax=Tieghemostelium lacteum TaxID=361077 RepID=A0A151Z9B7_TIELA|nr:hypothetical protein DLAC_09161 [Tieghemostelium lacteum]|eukprot:KYQ90536.1 hypothetical protein DLAC_09161 [Tieghemostelium lacteum]
MVQSWNSESLKCLKYVIKNKSLIVPHLRVVDIRDINYQQLKSMGFKGVLMDKDNTITQPFMPTIYEPYKDSIKECKRIFGDDNVAIISNSAGSSDDKNFILANAMEKSLGIHILKHNTKKPDGIQSVIDYFKAPPKDIVMIGDRFLTDILFGNLYGMFTIFTEPITSKGDNFVVKLIRNKEKEFVFNLIDKNGLKPPKHERYTEGTIKDRLK